MGRGRNATVRSVAHPQNRRARAAAAFESNAERFDGLFGAGRGHAETPEPEALMLAPMAPEGPIPETLTDTLKVKEFFAGGRRRQRISTGLKVFDNQTSMISTGNQIGGTMNGVCVRATETPFYPDSKKVAVPGQMRDFDIDQLSPSLPPYVGEFIRKAADHGDCRAYAFFHHTCSGEEVLHGFIITDEHHRFLRTFVTALGSGRILDVCAPYVAVRP
jgi:hypothetical protein